MEPHYESARLLLTELTLNEAKFIIELLNSPEWLRFIGERNVNSIEDAINYIKKILDNESVQYWIVKIKSEQMPIGIITLIQREYLPYPDIGFAFLSKHTKNGYAFEAASKILIALPFDSKHKVIHAVTLGGKY